MPSAGTYDVTRPARTDAIAYANSDGGYDIVAEGYVMPSDVGGSGLDFSAANNSMYLPTVM